MSDRWTAEPLPGDGADGRGEAGPAQTLDTRRETEEAAETGRFPAGDDVSDRSNPIEPDASAEG